ncbi:MAG: hypothetical protein IKX25_08420 [Bacteroidales bacterium]|nr:hypothetical protein [Bacteroidales bacterium]
MKTRSTTILLTIILWFSTSLANPVRTYASTPSEAYPSVVVRRHTHLVFPGKNDGLRRFYDKLHALRSDSLPTPPDEVNILHIGGSHVQGGELSNTIRMRFEPTGDRGLCFPFRAIKTNSPAYYRFDYTGLWKGSRNVSKQPDAELGLAGAAAITSDKEATLTLRLRDEGRWDFTQLIVLGQASDPSVIPFLTTQRGDTLWADPILSKVADIEGIWVYQLLSPDSVATLNFKGLRRTVNPNIQRQDYLPLEDSHFFILRGMIPTSWRHGITYTEAGVNGASLESWARCNYHFDQELSLLPPDLVIFGIGINDAYVPVNEFNPEVFKERYRQLIQRIRAVNPDCCFIWLTNNDSAMRHGRGRRRYYTPNQNGPRVQTAMKQLAEEYNGGVIDVFALMGGLGSVEKWIAQDLMKRDHIHFTKEGYQLIGNIISDAIAEDYAKYYDE